MKSLLKILAAVAVILVVVVGGLIATGNGTRVMIPLIAALGSPDLPFDPADAAPPPDYSRGSSWAATVEGSDLSDLIPAGIDNPPQQGNQPATVFYIHPTGFLNGSAWTFSMDPATLTEENTKWMLANQASAFNGCCRIFAPRYRQASIYTYFADEAVRDQVLAFAYQDVARAFDYFIEHHNETYAFFIASHSQGTHHAIRLLQEKVDKTPLAKRLVAAYIIGGRIAKSEFSQMEDITICQHAADTGCAVHWDTISEAEIDDPSEPAPGNTCVNPLSWEPDGGLASKDMHKGAVPITGAFQAKFFGDDLATGLEFELLGRPIANLVQAQCKDGLLFVTDLSGTEFAEQGALGNNYHGLDYPIFYMDIWENAKLRLKTFLRHASQAPGL